MSRILKQEPQPNGTTIITIDIDGVKTGQIIARTEDVGSITEEDIDAIHGHITNVVRPPVRKKKGQQ